MNVNFNKLTLDASDAWKYSSKYGMAVHHIRREATTQNHISFQIISVKLNISSSIVVVDDDDVVDDSKWDKRAICSSFNSKLMISTTTNKNQNQNEWLCIFNLIKRERNEYLYQFGESW